MERKKKILFPSLFASRVNFFIFFVFFLTAFLIIWFHFLFHQVRVLGMSISIFYLDEQITFSAFYTVVTSFLIGFLCLMTIGRSKSRKENLFWAALAVFFLTLSIDEYLEIHEYLNALIKLGFKKDNLLGQLAHFSWVFPLFLVILPFFCLFFWGLVNEKNPQVKLPLIAGVFCFIIVLFSELLGALTFGQHIYLYFVAIEEGAEMLGAAFFLLAVLNKTHILLTS